MRNNVFKKLKLALLVTAIALLSFVFSNTAFAEQTSISLKDLGADSNVKLRNTKTFRVFYFTKPDHWNLQPSSKLVLKMQHSSQLIPERSSLNILVNGQAVRSIELNKSNSSKTELSIPLPVKILKDYNNITFDVDQHYTYECEDPFDPALWTTILNSSTLQFDYSKASPKLDFAMFPYPFFDKLEYGKTNLSFVIPEIKDKKINSIKAMAVIDAVISQYIGWKQLDINVVMADKLSGKAVMRDLIIVGTPDENPAILRYESILPYKIRNNKFVGEDGQEIPSDMGLLIMEQNPDSKGEAILFVTGNSPEAVEKASIALSQKPTNQILKGPLVLVKETLPNELAEFRNWPGYVKNKKFRLIDLEEKSKTTRGVTSLPILYELKLIPDMFMPPRQYVKVAIDYSYAANLDPELSKLEILLNGVAMHSKVLDNTDGENLARFEATIPSEKFTNYNDLEFRFHLYPSKYDICRFTTDDHIWGTIHNTTSFELPAQIKTVIPDMGLINDGGYPFTAYRDMQENVFVLADDYNAYDIYGLLWTVARLSKMTNPTVAINFDVSTYSNLKDSNRKTKNLITIGTSTRNKLIEDLKTDIDLLYGEDGFKLFKKEKLEKLSKIKDIPDQGIVEQILSPWNQDRVIMIIYGQNDKGLLNAISLFSDDKKFKDLTRGNIVGVSDEVVSVVSLNKDQVKQLYGEQIERKAETFDFWWDLVKILFMIIGVIAVLKILFGAFIKGGPNMP